MKDLKQMTDEELYQLTKQNAETSDIWKAADKEILRREANILRGAYRRMV